MLALPVVPNTHRAKLATIYGLINQPVRANLNSPAGP